MTPTPPVSPREAGREFFEMLGRCISAWATVDDELFRIFRDCLGPYEQSAIIFYRLPGLDVRLGLTDEIAKSVLPEKMPPSGGQDHPSVVRWNALRKEFTDLLTVRRRLAHQPVVTQREQWFGFAEALLNSAPLGGVGFGGGAFYSGQPLTSLAVQVSDHERLRKNSASLAALKIEDLRSHLSAVRSLANDLNTFLRDFLIPACEEQLRKHGE